MEPLLQVILWEMATVILVRFEYLDFSYIFHEKDQGTFWTQNMKYYVWSLGSVQEQ